MVSPKLSCWVMVGRLGESVVNRTNYILENAIRRERERENESISMGNLQ
jgi:hypothetical protein